MSNMMKLNLTIDRNSKVPYYFQLYSNISQKIENNILKDGDKLPNEMELCEEFGLSRITIRQAYKELETNGYVLRERGRGTFVRKKIESRSLERFSSIVDELKKEGVKIKGEIIENLVIFPDDRIREILKLDPKEQILFVKRLVYANDSPLYITKVYIPYSLTGKISKKILTDNSFMKIITGIYNLKLIYNKSILEASLPNKETAKLLAMGENKKNVILFMQTFWTVKNSIGPKIIYLEDYFDSSKEKFVFEKEYT
jgi:GntR family transcriptional regulator